MQESGSNGSRGVLLQRGSVAYKMRENYLPQGLRHCLARAAVEVGPIDNKSGRCDLPSFPRFLSTPSCAVSVQPVCGGPGSLLKNGGPAGQISEQPRPYTHIENNGIQHFQHDQPVIHLHTATCNLPSVLLNLQSRPCQWTLRGLRTTEMVVRPQATRAPSTRRQSTGKHSTTRQRTTRQGQKPSKSHPQSRSPSSAASARSKKENTNAPGALFPSKTGPSTSPRPIQAQSGLLTNLKLLSRLLPPPQGESPTGRAQARASALQADPTGLQRQQQTQ